MSTAAETQAVPHDTYEQYYGFAQSPFALTPDPRFLYRSESHQEAIRLLLQAIRRKEGFIVLTGDIGTGKTTICRALLEQLDSTTFTSLVLNPFVTVEELLREVLLDFGVISREAVRSGRAKAATTHDLITALHEFLLSLMTIKGSAVLIIDEAQHLSASVLEQVRVISNLETNESKLLQIVLVGQLTLLDVLAEAELRQLEQRVSMRAALRSLTREEVEAYVAHRLSVAGESVDVRFEPEALDLVDRFSGGVPRLINLLCDRALMAGAASGSRRIAPALIEEAAGQLDLTPPAEPAPESPAGTPWALVAAAALVGAAAVIALEAWLPGFLAHPAPPPPARPALTRAEAAQPKSIPAADFLPPPLPAPPQARPAQSSREVPDDQVGPRIKS